MEFYDLFCVLKQTYIYGIIQVLQIEIITFYKSRYLSNVDNHLGMLFLASFLC